MRQGSSWYRGELHLHTNHSDAKASLNDMVAAAKEHGLDFIVLGDHNTVSSHKDIPRVGFPIIPGMELTTFHKPIELGSARALYPEEQYTFGQHDASLYQPGRYRHLLAGGGLS